MATDKPLKPSLYECLIEFRDLAGRPMPSGMARKMNKVRKSLEGHIERLEGDNHRLLCLLAQHQVTHWPRVRDLPKREQAAFRKVLSGQTVPLINGLPYEEQDAYYPWDYERWKKGLPVID